MTRRNVAVLSVLAAAAMWGTTGLAAAFLTSLNPIVIGAAAMGGGGLLQMVTNAPALRRDRRRLRDNACVVAVGAVCVAVYPLAFYSSMRMGGVALGTVVSLASAPVASAAIERSLDRRPLGLRWVIACTAGAIGAALLCLGHSGAGASSAPVVGVLLGLLAGSTYAGYSFALRRLMHRDVARGAAAGAVLGIGGLMLLPIAATGCIAEAKSLSATSWWILAYLAVVPMFLGYVLFSRGLAAVDATTATTLTLVEPAVATMLAVVVLSEQLGASGWWGMSMLGATLLLLATNTNTRRQRWGGPSHADPRDPPALPHHDLLTAKETSNDPNLSEHHRLSHRG